MFSKVLIANRGEIAVRVNHTLQQMGVRTLAVFSDPDRDAPHTLVCDEAYHLSGETAAETYLRADRIIEIARSHGADAIHPGYGFFSENADFAQQCEDAGVTFIGPTPDVIRLLGDKIQAKSVMEQAGIPVVPGWSGKVTDTDELKRHAASIDYPVLIKAAAGGGGKGMRVVREEADLSSAVEAAQREAGAAFGDTRIFIEKYIEKSRHIEVQVIGDTHGNVCHLFERECSIQRRHQKIIEESPSAALTTPQRKAICEAAVRAVRAVGYTNAGTVEFLVDQNGDFFFLEVNTRLQVEHPVTEMTTGVDLVRVQVEVAAGGKLPFTQESLQSRGHALECRICAEDPQASFMPATGMIEHYVQPEGPGVRVDSGIQRGSEVTVFYDPMLAKLICWAPTREEAIARMIWSLERYVVMGVKTNIEYLRQLVDLPAFRNADLHTHFLDDHAIELSWPDMDRALVAAAVAHELGHLHKSGHSGSSSDRGGQASPWRAGHHWRLGL